MNTTKTTKEQRKGVEIALFVPAKALEHLHNPEYATRRDKIIYAIRRFHQQNDFYSCFDATDPAPFVNIRKVEFNPKELGYKVEAIIC